VELLASSRKAAHTGIDAGRSQFSGRPSVSRDGSTASTEPVSSGTSVAFSACRLSRRACRAARLAFARAARCCSFWRLRNEVGPLPGIRALRVVVSACAQHPESTGPEAESRSRAGSASPRTDSCGVAGSSRRPPRRSGGHLRSSSRWVGRPGYGLPVSASKRHARPWFLLRLARSRSRARGEVRLPRRRVHPTSS